MNELAEVKKKCGIVMPISEIDGCDKEHWNDVFDIISESVANANFESKMVSDSDEIGLIHKNIIKNLYENPIIVCDVSCHNPNVMFELGIRLAFDKPAIIIKDDKTKYSFDIQGMEHLVYPRDLNHSKVIKFQKKLSKKIKETYKISTNNKNYSPFLKHFGKFIIAKTIDQKELPSHEYIMKEFEILNDGIEKINSNLLATKKYDSFYKYKENCIFLTLTKKDYKTFDKIVFKDIKPFIVNIETFSTKLDKVLLKIYPKNKKSFIKANEVINSFLETKPLYSILPLGEHHD